MPDIHGKAYWPGVSSIIGCTYTCSHGISPSFATLTFPLEDIPTIQKYANLIFSDNLQSLSLKDCSASEMAIVDTSSGGRAAQISILDRRWKWAFGSVSCQFNRRDARRGDPIGELKSPFDIAEWLLKQMGEADYKIDLPAGLSASETPLFEVENVPPAQALAQLCDQFARIVIFQPIANRVIIVQPGIGNGFPPDPPITFSASRTPVDLPGSVDVVGAPVIYTAALSLRAVGRDIDQTIKPIEELSYRPTFGWGQSRNRGWGDLTIPAQQPEIGVFEGVMTGEEIRQMAASCIWRFWQITLDDPAGTGTVQIPGLEYDAPDLKLTDIHQLEILEAIVLADPLDPKKKPYPIPLQVYGQVRAEIPKFDCLVRPTDLTAPESSLRGIGFTVDNEYKLLISDKYLYTGPESKNHPTRKIFLRIAPY